MVRNNNNKLGGHQPSCVSLAIQGFLRTHRKKNKKKKNLVVTQDDSEQLEVGEPLEGKFRLIIRLRAP